VNPSTPWTNVMFNDFWGTPLTHSGSHKSYRPLCVLSFRFNHWLHELKPGGYHLVNVLLHCTATALFTILARSLLPLRAEWATASAGALFASHPVHTEAVAGLVGRADVGAAIFFILAFIAYRRYASIRSTLLLQRRVTSSNSTSRSHIIPSSSSSSSSSYSSSLSHKNTSFIHHSLALPRRRSYLVATTCALFKWSGYCLGYYESTNSGNSVRTSSNCALQSNVAIVTGGGGGVDGTRLVIRKWLWLLATLICAACSMLTKEHGVTVLAVCAVYDLFVHSRLKLKDIFYSSSSFFQVGYVPHSCLAIF